MYIWIYDICIYGYMMYVCMDICYMYMWIYDICIYGYTMYVYMDI